MATVKTGKLTIAGSGIASIGHITLETLSYIASADKIYYAIVDPPTEAFILEKSKDRSQCFDLTVYYDKDKSRYDSYVQMSEVMLRDVRQGYNVLGIFYGHPGVFVFPSHRAIAIAREEGYVVKMLPGVSAEDYMFSDVGFDPARPGCMTQEATGLLLSGRKLDPSIHNIIWQVGTVGVQTMAFDNRQFHLLVDRFEEDLGLEHKVIHYVGAVLPQSTTVMEEYTVAELRREEVVARIGTASTFYLPPRGVRHVDPEIVRRLKGSELDSSREQRIATIHPYSRFKWVGGESPSLPAYGPVEEAAIGSLEDHIVPKEHPILRGSRELQQFMADLALQPDLRERYKADPASVVDAIPGLSATEKFALALNHPSPVVGIMRGTREAIANSEEPTVEELAAMVDAGPRELNASTIVIIIALV